MKKKTKQKIYSKNFTYLAIAALVIIVVGVVLAVGLRDNSTGASIFVEHHGVSGDLMETQAGKMQTYIKFVQPTLGELREEAGRLKVATDIAEVSEFPQGIEEMYTANPLVPLIDGADQELRVGASKENEFFKNDLTCLRNVGNNRGHIGELKVILISELKLQRCDSKVEKNNPWWYAYVRHTFYDDWGAFICEQDDSKLFLVNKESGQITADVSSC